jgi:hypothetical protein
LRYGYKQGINDDQLRYTRCCVLTCKGRFHSIRTKHNIGLLGKYRHRRVSHGNDFGAIFSGLLNSFDDHRGLA